MCYNRDEGHGACGGSSGAAGTFKTIGSMGTERLAGIPQTRWQPGDRRRPPKVLGAGEAVKLPLRCEDGG